MLTLRTLPITALLVALTRSSTLAADVLDVYPTVPFLQTLQGTIVVDVRIDGQGPFPMLLDTGATHSAVSPGIAAIVSAEPRGDVIVRGIVGQERRPVVRLNDVVFGPSVTDGVFATVTPRPELEQAGPVEGILGQDVLAALSLTIDFNTRRIAFVDDATMNGNPLPLEPKGNRFVVRLPQSHEEVRLVVDSGAEALVLFDRRTDRAAAAGRPAFVSGAAGGGAAHMVVLPHLRVGPVGLTQQPAVLVARGPEESVDGLLPLHLFSRVTIDGPGRRMFVEPR